MCTKNQKILHTFVQTRSCKTAVIIIYTFINEKKDPPPGVLQDGPTPSLNPPTRKNIKKGLTISQIGDIIKSMKGGELK